MAGPAKSLHEARFPNETAEYRYARDIARSGNRPAAARSRRSVLSDAPCCRAGPHAIHRNSPKAMTRVACGSQARSGGTPRF